MLVSFLSCAEKETKAGNTSNQKCECSTDEDKSQASCCMDATKDSSAHLLKLEPESKPRIVFVELGSIRCIPCKQMQPVMASIEKKYGSQIEVIFYDVWTDEDRKYATEYGIRLIPTQVFLDQNGKEIFRHEGFFPESEIDAFLQKQGLSIKTKTM